MLCLRWIFTEYVLRLWFQFLLDAARKNIRSCPPGSNAVLLDLYNDRLHLINRMFICSWHKFNCFTPQMLQISSRDLCFERLFALQDISVCYCRITWWCSCVFIRQYNAKQVYIVWLTVQLTSRPVYVYLNNEFGTQQHTENQGLPCVLRKTREWSSTQFRCDIWSVFQTLLVF
jgi:hypothetical protein